MQIPKEKYKRSGCTFIITTSRYYQSLRILLSDFAICHYFDKLASAVFRYYGLIIEALKNSA